MLPANPVAAVIGAAAALEVPTRAVLIVDPSLFSWLLFGADMTPPGQALGRISGVALLAIAVACWPRRGTGAPSMAALLALLLFSVPTAAYLLYLGIRQDLVGILPWPAAAAHFVLAILLAVSWSRTGVRQEPHDRGGGGK